ncbi:MAG: hypothetical protein JXQ72_02195, partial [Anaerolineae bacterium]|nr:hypothetical protein [Anaerolineae bacterium]
MMKLNNREITLMVISVVVGLLLGMILVGSSDDLRTSLFGTAAEDKNEEQAVATETVQYYLVDVPSAQDWLAEKYPANVEVSQVAADELAKLIEAFEFRSAFLKAKEDGYVDAILPQMYAALAGVENVEALKVDENNPMSVCLGLDDDLYGEPGIYLYLTVPANQVKDVGIPETAAWKMLDEPKSDTLYWQLLACYPEPEA